MTNANNRIPVDAPQRQLCLEPHRSFSVRAPAGSGKTELLTQRVLVLLANVEKPEAILSITFTRKAAAEMLDRILGTLRWAATTAQPESGYKREAWQLAQNALTQDKKQDWNLLQNPTRLRIQTIDGLCARLTKNLPTLCRFGAQPNIAQDPFPLYQQAVERLLAELESDSEVADALAHVLSHLDNQVDKLQPLLTRLLARRDQWLGLMGVSQDFDQARAWLEQAIERLVNEELSQLRDTLLPFQGEIMELIDYAASNLSASDKADSPLCQCLGLTELPPANAEGIALWQGVGALLLTNNGTWRKQVTVRDGFPADINGDKAAAKARKEQMLRLLGELQLEPELAQRIQRATKLPPDTYPDNQWAILQSLTLLLPHLVAHLLLTFAEHNSVDYPQITQGALMALGHDEDISDLSLMLDYQIQHILVDEFQDTSSPQIELLKRLMRGWQPGDGRSLFIVGDGMQSCYGFRDANVGLFLDARQHGIGDMTLEPVDLSVNFRSQQPVVDWVNNTFSAAFPAEDDIARGAVSYAHSEAFHQTGTDTESSAALENLDAQASFVSIDAFAGYPDRQAEAERVADIIEQNLAEHPQDNIALLVRSRPHLKSILPVLRQRGLRWQATDLDPLATRMWVVDVISLMKLLLNPADRIAWLSVLRAPWCGLSHADLLVLCGSEHQQAVILNRLQLAPELPLSTDGKARVLQLQTAVTAAWRDRQRKSLRQEVEGLWLALSGQATLPSAAAQDDVRRVLDLIESHQQAGWMDDLPQFERELEKLYAAADNDADARIQVMTLHKSKGLEFDTVIIAGLDRKAQKQDTELLLWQERITQEGDRDLLLSPLSATGEDKDPLHTHLRSEQALKDEMEGTRLFYVGATRAVKRLYLVAHTQYDDKKDQAKAPNKSSLIAPIWPLITEQMQLHICQSDADAMAQKPQITQLLRLPAGFADARLQQSRQAQPLIRSNLDSSKTINRNSATNVPDFCPADPARIIGTVTHRILYQMVLQPARFNDAATLGQQHHYWTQLLREQGLNQSQILPAIQQIHSWIEPLLDNKQAQWLLNPDHAQSACELALGHGNAEFGEQLSIIDRTFVDAQGARWIIDYKTSQPAHDQSLDDFIAQESRQYRPQLSRYASLFKALGESDIRTALFFVAMGHLHELELSS